MKFDNIEQLKQFIIWAKKEKVSSFSVGEVSFTISDMAHIPDYGPILGGDVSAPAVVQNSEMEPEEQEYRPNSKTWTDSELKPEDEDELLFWSANSN